MNLKPSYKHLVTFGALVVFFLILQYQRLVHLAPPPEYIWDNIYLWDWARSFSHGDFSNFLTDSHHLMRWGNWLPAAVSIELFSDSVAVYYLSTAVPSSLGILLFIYLAYRHVGVTAALLFIALWFFDALLFRATFQLLPSGAGLLPSAVLLALCLNLIERGQVTKTWIAAASVSIFWLYGTKETHLAFLPGILLIVANVGGIRPVLCLIGIFIVGYILETVFFMQISSEFSPLGRVYGLVNGGQHVKIMLENTRYVAQQTQYFDSGITMRWVKTSGVTPIVLFPAFIVGMLALLKRSKDKLEHNFVSVIAVLLISFIIFTTFFVISINPIRLGHGLVPRYVTLLMPFAYLLLIAFLTRESRGAPIAFKIGFILLVPFLVAPSVERYSNYPDLSIWEVSRRYEEFGKQLKPHDCVRAKQKSIVMNQLDLVPEAFRDERLNRLITNDDLVVREGHWYVTKTDIDQQCKNMYTINRNNTMRY